MKLNNLKRLAVAGALGLMFLLGTTEIANAQNNRRERERRIEQQQRRIDRQQERLDNRRYRIYRNGSYYNTDSRGAELLRQAVNSGYQQGFRSGQMDRNRRSRYNYGGISIYRNGNYGYQNYVDSSQYRYYFQQGFQRGYEDGFYSRNQYGSNGVNVLGSILNTILNIRID